MCVLCHAGIKGESRAAEKLMYLGMSPAELAVTTDEHCALIIEQEKV